MDSTRNRLALAPIQNQPGGCAPARSGKRGLLLRAAGKVAELPWQGVFKYLARIESEHASTIRKALGLAANPAAEQYDVTPDLKAVIGEVKRRESRAEEFYGKALEEASEPRVQEIFSILIEIEADHLHLANETLGKLV